MAENASPLSELNLLNLNYLATLQATAQRDPAQAVYLFGLRYEDVMRVRSLSIQALQRLALSADQCLCTLRMSAEQLAAIADAPAAVAGPLTTVRTPPSTQKLVA
jgi:hypothetical protein